MAPTTATTGSKAGRKKKVTGAEPIRRSTRPQAPRSFWNAAPAGVEKSRAPAKPKKKPTVKDKVEGAVKKAKGTVTKKPAVKAAGTKKAKGTDSKGTKKTKAVKP